MGPVPRAGLAATPVAVVVDDAEALPAVPSPHAASETRESTVARNPILLT
jgi:hypothetical protein